MVQDGGRNHALALAIGDIDRLLKGQSPVSPKSAASDQIGALNSSVRTGEQTQIATFSRASPTAIWNPVLSQVLATRDLDLSATARIFALFYLAAADASISCWEAKYTIGHYAAVGQIQRR